MESRRLLLNKQKQKERLVEEKLRQTELKELKLREQEYHLREQGLKELNELLMLGRLVQGITSFTIIHGKGNGILQKGIHDYLKKSSFVQEYYFAKPEQGGSGKTVVILKG